MTRIVKDINLSITPRNNLILTKMRENHIKSVAELERRVGLTSGRLGSLVNMRISARRSDDSWTSCALKLAVFFKCIPEDLFSRSQQYSSLRKNRVEAEIAFEDLRSLVKSSSEISPLAVEQAKDLKALVHSLVGKLPARIERVLRARFGFSGQPKTLDEIAVELGISRAVVSVIESNGINLLRRFGRGRLLRTEGGSDPEIREALSFIDE